MTTGSTAYPKWGLSWTYDRYGNRTDQNQTAGSPPMNHVTVDATTNRIITTGYTYDVGGNMTNDGSNTLTYDAENRGATAAGATYTYDGHSLRVKKVSGSTTTVYIFSGSQVVAEYVNGAAPTAPTREYIYSGGALLARIDSSGTKYYHQDHLSNRLVTDSSGNTSAQLGHFPFGESWYNTSSDKLLFTTYERDAESGNDYAMARYHVNRLARFSSPDPLAGSIASPQSLNRYAYVRNDPINSIDPLGLFTDNPPLPPDPIGDGPTFGPDFGFLGGGGIKGDSPRRIGLDDKNKKQFEKAKTKALNNVENPDCQAFLKSRSIDPSAVADAIANEVPWDGTKSSISQYDAGVLDPQDDVWKTQRGIDSAKATSVNRYFNASGTGSTVKAEAQTPGHDVYFQPGTYLLSFKLSSGGITPGIIIHEGLHNLTGLGDTALANKLGLPAGAGSAQINPLLAANHCI
ncbi:MAG TPA: RHS repeat-associated core domain-containing protein [Candidatus Acidoferrum sp.]|nr:RHS repeat-associated core domain-containing protein [Candidatus Acidoferrum sp.]